MLLKDGSLEKADEGTGQFIVEGDIRRGLKVNERTLYASEWECQGVLK